MTDPNATEPRKPGKRRWLLILLVLALLGGGGFAGWYFLVRVTVDDVRAKYRSQFADLRAKLKRVEENLPPMGSVSAKDDSLPANLDPKPSADREGRAGNTAFVTAGGNSSGSGRAERFDLSSFRFRGTLNEFGDDVPPNRKSADKELAREYEQALALKYLVVSRAVRFEPIKVTEGLSGTDRSFSGGELDLEVFLVDLATEKPVGSFRRSLRPDESVLATVRKGKIDTSSVAITIAEGLESKVAGEVRGTLKRATGGTFE